MKTRTQVSDSDLPAVFTALLMPYCPRAIKVTQKRGRSRWATHSSNIKVRSTGLFRNELIIYLGGVIKPVIPLISTFSKAMSFSPLIQKVFYWEKRQYDAVLSTLTNLNTRQQSKAVVLNLFFFFFSFLVMDYFENLMGVGEAKYTS